MKILIRFVLVCLLCGCSILANAQEPKTQKDESETQINKLAYSKKAVRNYYFLVTYHIDRNEYSDALLILKKLLRYNPSNYNYYFHAGICLYHLGDYPAAREHLTIASTNVSQRYRDSAFETYAPEDVYRYLELTNQKIESRQK
jgi:tetratricopeptide (TPR) repeat protein